MVTPTPSSAARRALVPHLPEAGRVTPATVADHIESHRGDFNAFRLGQLRSLCADCHNSLDATNRTLVRSRLQSAPTARRPTTPSVERGWLNPTFPTRCGQHRFSGRASLKTRVGSTAPNRKLRVV